MFAGLINEEMLRVCFKTVQGEEGVEMRMNQIGHEHEILVEPG